MAAGRVVGHCLVAHGAVVIAGVGGHDKVADGGVDAPCDRHAIQVVGGVLGLQAKGKGADQGGQADFLQVALKEVVNRFHVLG